MKKLAVFDIDGTLRTERSPWRHLHAHLGLADKASDFFVRFKNQEITYSEWVCLDAGLWKGIHRDALMTALDVNSLRQGAQSLVDKFRDNGYDLLAISTGLDIFNDNTCHQLGIPHHISNKLEFDGEGHFTGKVEIFVDDVSKAMVLQKFLRETKRHYDYVFAVGDSEGDLSLFNYAQGSLAVMPTTEAVRTSAKYSVNKEPIDLVVFGFG